MTPASAATATMAGAASTGIALLYNAALIYDYPTTYNADTAPGGATMSPA